MHEQDDLNQRILRMFEDTFLLGVAHMIVFLELTWPCSLVSNLPI